MRKNTIEIIITSLIICISSIFLSASQDSLLTALKNAPNDSEEKVNLLNDLADINTWVKNDQALEYAQEALRISKNISYDYGLGKSNFNICHILQAKSEYDSSLINGRISFSIFQSLNQIEGETDALNCIGMAHYRVGNIDSAQIYYNRAFNLSDEIKYLKAKATALKGLGDIHERSSEYDLAMEKYKESYDLSLSIGYDKGVVRGLNDIGIILEYTGKIDQALAKYLEGLQYAENKKILFLSGVSASNIGTLYFIQKKYDKAIEYAQIALKYYQKIKNIRGVGFVYQDMGQILKAQNRLDEALIQYRNAKDIRLSQNDKRGLSFTYFGMAWTYKRMGNMARAREYMKKSLALREELGFERMVMACIRALAQFNMAEKRYKEAYPYLKRSYDWALNANSAESLYESSEAMVKYYEVIGDLKGAYYYQKTLLDAKDSLFNVSQNESFAEMQTLYETEKKEREILELEKNNTKITTQRNYIMGGSLALGLLSLFGFQWQKVRKERNDKKEFAEALLFTQEEERKRIARDLHDGIGQSLLLVKKQLEKNTSVTLENQILISDTLEEVRSISQDLHPFQIEKFGVTAAIKDVITKVEKSTELFITSEIDDIDGILSDKAEINIYRIIQEALNNVIKHAQATAVKMTLTKNDGKISLLIQDNGRGFDHEMAIVRSKSLGLKTMVERVSTIGGSLRFSDNDGSGTRLDVTVPVAN